MAKEHNFVFTSVCLRIEQMFEDGLIAHWTEKYLPVDQCYQDGSLLSPAALETIKVSLHVMAGSHN